MLLSVASVVCELLGAVAFGYGLWLMYPPLMWIWIGIACYGVSVTLARTGKQ